MIKFVHPVAGIIALFIISTFWLSTAASELSASAAMVVLVKTAIPWGFLLLVPALALAGGSGLSMAGGTRSGVVGAKLGRMPIIAANGILILAPSALFLASRASAGEFDATFYAVQAIELLAGAANIALLGLSMRDGFRLTGKLNRQGKAPEVRLIGREIIADDTIALRFSKPLGFDHVAGQYVTLTLPKSLPTDAKGRGRSLTLASAPSEPELMVATRLRGTAFKQALKTLPIGSTLHLSGARGEMVLQPDGERPVVFLAGGIGITPFLAMARQAAEAKLPHRITLFYANRRPEDAPFLKDLRELEQANPNFRLIATMTVAASQDNPADHEGRIDAAMLRRYLDDLREPVYYVAGPSAMVGAMRKLLNGLGVADEAIRSENFIGY